MAKTDYTGWARKNKIMDKFGLPRLTLDDWEINGYVRTAKLNPERQGTKLYAEADIAELAAERCLEDVPAVEIVKATVQHRRLVSNELGARRVDIDRRQVLAGRRIDRQLAGSWIVHQTCLIIAYISYSRQRRVRALQILAGGQRRDDVQLVEEAVTGRWTTRRAARCTV